LLSITKFIFYPLLTDKFVIEGIRPGVLARTWSELREAAYEISLQALSNDRYTLVLEIPGIPVIFRIQTVSLKVLDLKFKVLDEII
jgi:uncharacterized protein YjeT (DUF2065 family)